MSDDIAIRVENVSKSFKLPHEKHGSVKNAFVNIFRGKTTYEKQEALKDISFEIKKGEFFGIVGRNGSGKSTLLKLLAGIYSPDKGAIQINGKLTPFIELGVGFNPELTGRENVFLNGALLGFSREEMYAMYEEIVEFAELEKFMDQKLKNYSSGMQVRLAFSVAIRANSEILLIDEVLAVGDAAFQKKCFDIFNDIKRSGTTVIFVTHDMGAVEQFCDRAVLIEKGRVELSSSSQNVAFAYQDITQADAGGRKKISGKASRQGNGTARINELLILNNQNKSLTMINDETKTFVIKMEVIINKKCTNPIFGITIRDPSGSPLFLSNTKASHIRTGDFKHGDTVSVSWSIDNVFNTGVFILEPAVAGEDGLTVFDSLKDHYTLNINKKSYLSGLVYFDHKIEIVKRS